MSYNGTPSDFSKIPQSSISFEYASVTLLGEDLMMVQEQIREVSLFLFLVFDIIIKVFIKRIIT